MQEILFSAKRIDNGYTVCGYHVKDGVTGKHFIVAEGSMLHESDKVGEEGLLNFVAFEVDEDTISVTGDGWIPVEKRKAFCDSAEKCADGKCVGYGKSEMDDEPIEMCKRCKSYVGFEESEEE